MMFKQYLAICMMVLVLAACSTGVEPDKPESNNLQQADVPESFDRRTALGRNSDPSVVTLGTGRVLKERLMSEGEALPDDVLIDTVNLNEIPVTTALQAVLADTNISLTWQQGEFDDRLVTILNLSGQLPDVINRICSAGRVYCTYRNGTLEVKENETFIIEMPAIPDGASNTISDVIEKLAGDDGDVSVDTDGGNIIYSADTAGHNRVSDYLAQLRRGRPLIVIQLYLWDVSLDESSDSGIRWDAPDAGSFMANATDVQLVNRSGGLGSTTVNGVRTAFDTLSGNTSFGAVLSGNINAAVVLAFLKKNGDVRTVSNPQMTFVSGTGSEFSIGGKRSYISGVGQLVGSSTATGGSANTGVSSNTVQTEEIETGIRVKVNGSFESGVVFGELEIEDTTLVDIESIQSAGTEIQLPITTERNLKTIIRLRPGDTLLLAGLRSQRDESSRSGLPTIFGTLPNASRNATQNRELVIMLRPSIIRFSEDKVDEREPPLMIRRAINITPTPAALAPAPAPEPFIKEEMPADENGQGGHVDAGSLQRALGDIRRSSTARGTGNTLTMPPKSETGQ